jgi:hypothetical protein
MRMRMSPESEVCAVTKNVLFSSSPIIDQRFLQFINKALINYKDRQSNKSEIENRTFFLPAHNSDSGYMRMRITLIVYGISRQYNHLKIFEFQKYH